MREKVGIDYFSGPLSNLDGKVDAISSSIQLVAGRTAQTFNQRKGRKGAFWEDRYHATAIESGEHLLSCLVYMDMNMVRAGVVSHPSEWEYCGYHEIQSPPQRYRLIDRGRLIELAGATDDERKSGSDQGKCLKDK